MSVSKRASAVAASVVGLVTIFAMLFAGSATAADPTPYPSGTVTGTPIPSPSGSTSPTSTSTGGGGGGGSVVGGSLSAGATLTLGQSVSLTLRVNPGDVVSLQLFSAVVNVGSKTAGADGLVTFDFTLPSSLGCGDHHAVAQDTTTDTQVADIPFSVSCSAAGSGSVGGGTASTGVAVGVIGGVGVVCVIGGALLLFAGRRRRAHA